MLPSMLRDFLYRMEATGVWRLDLIGPQEIQDHYMYLYDRPNARRGGGLSSRMLGHHLFALRTFFVWLVRLEAIPFDPMTGLDFPRPTSPGRTALSEEEVQAIYAHCSTPLDRALLALYYGCGLRRQEALDLDLQDVDLLNARLTVRAGKYAKRREIPYPPRVAEDLCVYVRYERPLRVRLQETDGRRAFLLNSQGRRLSGSLANKRVQALAHAATITSAVSLHHLRTCLH
jgi:integrase/recombinase XerD